MVCKQAHCLTVWKEFRNSSDGNFITRPAVGRHDDTGIADVEIHMAGRHDLAILIHMSPSRRDCHHVNWPCLRAVKRIGEHRRIGIVIAKWLGQSQHTGGNKARKIIDMAIGMVIFQSHAEP